MTPQRPDYGIDAPGLVRMFFVLGTVTLALALVLGLASWLGPRWSGVVAAGLGLASAYCLGMGCFMIYGSKVGKLARRERLLRRVPWSGVELVLDVGCGRGLMMIGAAKRLSTGKAIGIDLWVAEDQSDNHPDATMRNARIEGVAEHVEVRTADMRALPFANDTFDVIVSHWSFTTWPRRTTGGPH